MAKAIKKKHCYPGYTRLHWVVVRWELRGDHLSRYLIFDLKDGPRRPRDQHIPRPTRP